MRFESLARPRTEMPGGAGAEDTRGCEGAIRVTRTSPRTERPGIADAEDKDLAVPRPSLHVGRYRK